MNDKINGNFRRKGIEISPKSQKIYGRTTVELQPKAMITQGRNRKCPLIFKVLRGYAEKCNSKLPES
ncbi:MAG: hypothetical protein C4324_01980 [Blastocatellia bacterium]